METNYRDTHADDPLWVGFITYADLTARYLPQFLNSLRGQTGVSLRCIAFDNTPAGMVNGNRDIVASYPELELMSEEGNIGFSRAYNLMMRRARDTGAKFFLALNPDTMLEPTALAEMMRVLRADDSLGSVAPKLRRWDFVSKGKTNFIDSCGLHLGSGLRFSDVGQGENDRGQYDHAAILGPSGAAALYRLSALEKIAEKENYFDEHFFMYKEDCDLAYRLHLAGYGSKLVSSALIYHDRSDSGGSLAARFVNRFFKRSRDNRRRAFINQHLLFIKYWRQQGFFSKLSILWQLKLRFFAALILEPYLLREYKTIRRLAPDLQRY